VQRITGMRNTHERKVNDMGLTTEDYKLIAYSIEHERGATGL
jgi:5-bromo-4-chloroindolyl phosphate hydrolysis protein